MAKAKSKKAKPRRVAKKVARRSAIKTKRKKVQSAKRKPIANHRKHKPAKGKRHHKRTAKRARPAATRKPVARKRKLAKPVSHAKKKAKRNRTPQARELDKARSKIRNLEEAIRTISREPVDTSEADGPMYKRDLPHGATDIRYVEGTREVESFIMPDYVGPQFDEMEWGNDWDETYDDVGEEDEDSYAEDAK